MTHEATASIIQLPVPAARKRRKPRVVRERWRSRVGADAATADADGIGIGKPSTALSVALHLLVKGRLPEARKVADELGMGIDSLCTSLRLLTATPEDLMREQRQVAVILSGVMAVNVAARPSRPQQVHVDQGDRDAQLVRAWRSGWVDAVLGEEPGRAWPGRDARAVAAREGAEAFRRRFADFMLMRESDT